MLPSNSQPDGELTEKLNTTGQKLGQPWKANQELATKELLPWTQSQKFGSSLVTACDISKRMLEAGDSEDICSQSTEKERRGPSCPPYVPRVGEKVSHHSQGKPKH